MPDTHEEDEEGGSVWTLTLSGSGAGITASATKLTQDSKGVPGSNEVNDAFGSSMVLGDLDHDGYADWWWAPPARASAAGRGPVA